MSASRYTRTPYLVVYSPPVADTRKDVYGAVGEHIAVQAMLMRGDAPSDTAIVTMHPIGSQAYLPIFAGLARNGHHVISCANRYISGDFTIQFENLMLDLAACIRDARERLGYRRIVLAGWSGGGSLIAGYQAEAEDPRIKSTAAGEFTPLAGADLPLADAVMLLAPHRSRHHLLTEFLDPSVIDETDPDRRDPALNLYDSSNPNQPPYSAEFVARYREAQKGRNRRITAWVEARLEQFREEGRADREQAFVVHGTMADPRWLDLSLEPNQRELGSYIGEPSAANDSLAALARYSSLRSWLSQWSLDRAQFDAVEAVGRIAAPILVVVNAADDACPTSHTDAIYAAISHDRKSRSVIAEANHYYAGKDQKGPLAEALGVIDAWLAGLEADNPAPKENAVMSGARS